MGWDGVEEFSKRVQTLSLLENMLAHSVPTIMVYLVCEIGVSLHLVEVFHHRLISLPRSYVQWSVTVLLQFRV